MLYPNECKTIIDITKPPYNCDNSGEIDCTEALCRAMDDVLKPNIYGIERALEKLNANDDADYKLSFEICKNNGVPNVIFPEDLEPAKILYFPKGTYLVSDTISHNLENLKNILNGNRVMEINRQIYIQGENMYETVIKLKDNCRGFGFGDKKPVVSYIRTERSNIAMTNLFADITIDCGRGNSGAVGLLFYSNNSGAVRNVIIKSSDDENRGFCGLYVDRSMEGYIKNLTVIGFDYGVRIEKTNAPVACENICVKNQRVTGFYVLGANVPVHCLKSENKVTAFRAEEVSAMAALIDADCSGGDKYASAIVIQSGEAYLREVKTEGYRWPLIIGSQCHHFDSYIKEASTSEKRYTLFDCEELSLGLDIEDAPEDYEPVSLDDMACVDDFGAIGDGVTDSTYAIQKALDCGKPYIYFGSGHYLVNKTVEIPSSVRTIDFMFCDFYVGELLKNSRESGFLRISQNSTSHLSLRRVFAWEKFYGVFRFIEHSSMRTLVLRDLHTQCAGMYFNTVGGGKVFIENVACTMGGDEFCKVTPFEFKGQKVWARNINPERGDVQILNNNSDLWILGMKTETHVGRFASIAVKAINGGRTECFGVYSGIGGKGIPLYINHNSSLSSFFRMNGSSPDSMWDILVEETQQGETKTLSFSDAFKLNWYSCRVPGYIGRAK